MLNALSRETVSTNFTHHLIPPKHLGQGNSPVIVLFNNIQHIGFFQPVKKSVKIISLQKKPNSIKIGYKIKKSNFWNFTSLARFYVKNSNSCIYIITLCIFWNGIFLRIFFFKPHEQKLSKYKNRNSYICTLLGNG
jgi:hypothetical protein